MTVTSHCSPRKMKAITRTHQRMGQMPPPTMGGGISHSSSEGLTMISAMTYTIGAVIISTVMITCLRGRLYDHFHVCQITEDDQSYRITPCDP